MHKPFTSQTARTAQIREPIPAAALDTFEGGLLYSILADDHPYRKSDDASVFYLGSDDLRGEGLLTFGGDLEDLERWIANCKQSSSDIAARLLPSLEDGHRRQSANADDYASFQFSAFKAPDGQTLSITVPEIMQALIAEHGDLLGVEALTLTGVVSSDGPEAGGYGVFVTANDIEATTTEEWLDKQIEEFAQTKSFKL
jgi:hypothetical protein